MDIPQRLVEHYRESSAGRSWLKKLPRLIDAALKRWTVEIDAQAMAPPALPDSNDNPQEPKPWTGHSGIAIPVRKRASSEANSANPSTSHTETLAVLKVSFPHDGLVVDHEALTLWDTPSVVRLLDMHTSDHAFLLERLDGHRSLTALPLAEAVPVWGEVARSVAMETRSIDWSPPQLQLLDRIPRQSALAADLLRNISERWERLDHPLEPWLYQQAVDFLGGWLRDGQRHDALVNTDMHFENILARMSHDPHAPGWVMIDPQVIIGEPEFSLAPLLWNRVSEYDDADPVADVQERAHLFAEAAGMDANLALMWSVVRNLDNALEEIDEAQERSIKSSRISKSGAQQWKTSWAERSVWVAAASMGRVHPGLSEHTSFPAL